MMTATAPVQTSDYILVGSGINSLVCAAILSGKGQRVLILERNSRPGGCVRSEQLTLPGFVHDVLSSWYPAFLGSGAYRVLGESLHRHGMEFCNTDRPAGVVLPDGRHFVLRRDRRANVEAMEACHPGDGDRYSALMVEFERTLDSFLKLMSSDFRWRSVMRDAAGVLYRDGVSGATGFAANCMQSARALLTSTFESDLLRAFLAPWALHAGLGPEAAGSAPMMRLLPFSVEVCGMPLVRGGSSRLVEAFASLIREQDGELHTDCDVSGIDVCDGRAQGVHTADGRYFAATRGVICNVTPGQLYGRLLSPQTIPDERRLAARNFRHGRACMQIHLALREPPRWRTRELDDVAYVHVTSGMDGVSRAVNEADRGLLPADATIAVGQPALVDASRAPEGAGMLWLQLLELPPVVRGDAAGKIAVPRDGRWTDSVREAYADRIVARVAEHVENLGSSLLSRKVLSPADLASLNINLVGGDPFGGDCSPDQALFCRPFPGGAVWQTPVRNVYHVGASTHPGHNLGAGSGFGLAQQLHRH